MATARIKKSWTKLATLLRLAFFKKIVENLEKVPPPIATAVPPVPTLRSLLDAATGTQKQIDDLDQQIKALRPTRDAQIDALAAAIELEASAVVTGTNGDAGQIIAIGYDVVTDRQAVGPMTQVLEMAVTAGDNAGELNPAFHPVEGADNYEVQVNTDPTKPAGWTTKLTSSQSCCIIPGLPSGTRHWVRARANGPLGPGPWSDEASGMVP
jgi:hypothetical protein